MKKQTLDEANSRAFRNKYLKGLLVPRKTHAALEEIARKEGRIPWSLAHEFIVRGMAEYLKEKRSADSWPKIIELL